MLIFSPPSTLSRYSENIRPSPRKAGVFMLARLWAMMSMFVRSAIWRDKAMYPGFSIVRSACLSLMAGPADPGMNDPPAPFMQAACQLPQARNSAPLCLRSLASGTAFRPVGQGLPGKSCPTRGACRKSLTFNHFLTNARLVSRVLEHGKTGRIERYERASSS